LIDARYTDARVCLAEMLVRNEAPKLGALCRWVRDLDVVSGLSLQVDGVSQTTSQRSAKDIELLRVLDAILRVTGPVDDHCIPSSKSSDPIALCPAWKVRDSTPRPDVQNGVSKQRDPGHLLQDIEQRFMTIETTPGPLRKPPNLHQSVLYLSQDNAVPLQAVSPQTQLHKHPAVPNLSLIEAVLSPEECNTIISATESVGFLPDAPLRDDGAEASVLAHNVYWVVDIPFHDTLWERVRPFLPTHVAGRKARGINRRFRVYRYVPGAEYRCHVDGAWPPSGVSPSPGHPCGLQYHWDASPEDNKQSSLFTFLIYLNDDFEGGETTFFVPSVRSGVMNAYPVKPVMGSVVVFPHGEAKGALLHEGTGVRVGTKYIIRTDVEFDVKPT